MCSDIFSRSAYRACGMLPAAKTHNVQSVVCCEHYENLPMQYTEIFDAKTKAQIFVKNLKFH